MDFIFAVLDFAIKFTGGMLFIGFLVFVYSFSQAIVTPDTDTAEQIRKKEQDRKDKEEALKFQMFADAINAKKQKQSEIQSQIPVALRTARRFKSKEDYEAEFMPPELRKHLGLS